MQELKLKGWTEALHVRRSLEFLLKARKALIILKGLSIIPSNLDFRSLLSLEWSLQWKGQDWSRKIICKAVVVSHERVMMAWSKSLSHLVINAVEDKESRGRQCLDFWFVSLCFTLVQWGCLVGIFQKSNLGMKRSVFWRGHLKTKQEKEL